MSAGAYVGGAVPPAGAFSRRRSACMVAMWCYVVEVGIFEQRIVFRVCVATLEL